MSIVSDIHSYLRRSAITGSGALRDASGVPLGIHKTYPRMPQLKLPEPEHLDVTLSEVLDRRTSSNEDTNITEQTIGTLFGLALRGHTNSHRRRYPSAGALYPIETYFLSHGVFSTTPSVFHYNPSTHTLELLWSLPEDTQVSDYFRNPYMNTPTSNLIVFTSVWKRSGDKYGDLSYALALLEAGHMSENVLLAATGIGISSCALGGFKDDALTRLLDLDQDIEQPVLAISLR